MRSALPSCAERKLATELKVIDLGVASFAHMQVSGRHQGSATTCIPHGASPRLDPSCGGLADEVFPHRREHIEENARFDCHSTMDRI